MPELSLSLTLLQGFSYGCLLFMLVAGFVLVYNMMGVLNFAHASFYMLGAYVGYSVQAALGLPMALLLAPAVAAVVGALVEWRWLSRVHVRGHMAELLLTYGFGILLVEGIQLIWGRLPLAEQLPVFLQGPAWVWVQAVEGGNATLHWVWADALWRCPEGLVCTPFPAARAFMVAVSLAMALALWLLLSRTRLGLIIQAASQHPEMVAALGHNVPRVRTLVFALGAALAALAGVVAAQVWTVEPGMASHMGALMFVVVVVAGFGSLMGSLWGAVLAAQLLGLTQALLLDSDTPVAQLLNWSARTISDWPQLARLTAAQCAPVWPYLLLLAVLALRPQGLFGHRETVEAL